MGLRLRGEGREKKSLIWLFAPFFKSKSLPHQKENEKFGVSKKFQHSDCNHREKENFIFLFRWFIDHVSRLSPAPLHDLPTLSNSVKKKMLFPLIKVLQQNKRDRD